MIENCPCEICSSRPAKVVVLRRRHGDLHRTFVCPECASERARLYSNAGVDFDTVLGRLGRSVSGESRSYTCKLCGATLADLVVDGRPGCCLCYSRFTGDIITAVEEAQGRSYHTGKTPQR